MNINIIVLGLLISASVYVYYESMQKKETEEARLVEDARLAEEARLAAEAACRDRGYDNCEAEEKAQAEEAAILAREAACRDRGYESCQAEAEAARLAEEKAQAEEAARLAEEARLEKEAACRDRGFSSCQEEALYAEQARLAQEPEQPTKINENLDSGITPPEWTISVSTGDGWRFTGTPQYGGATNERPDGTYAWVNFREDDAGVVMQVQTIDVSDYRTYPILTFDYFSDKSHPTEITIHKHQTYYI